MDALQADRQIKPFHLAIAEHGLRLDRQQTTTLQVNLGLRCNQACRHCHLDAGPHRLELMDAATIDQVVAYAGRSHFKTIDITGGAPEMHPDLANIISRLAPLASQVILRSNLSALNDGSREFLYNTLTRYRVVITASFPSLNESQAESQRGPGIFRQSVEAINRLNGLGYGRMDSGLTLNLVANPAGAFLPASQAQTEKRFRQVLHQKWGITFNNLFTFANVPLGRFREWLIGSGNYDRYMEMIAANFNACAVAGLMCRTLVSVSWDGYLYDCDFNLALDLPLVRGKTHVSQMDGPPEPGSLIAVRDHCYTCAAGSGFT
ncbi:MAG: arsenosugar biosynthesis radical SAM protein ArsS [Deltaproteobacteria bacterium]|nr:arsenosugar biosynthesis radical SAM protein ArsS [Deltaproteobacteria bacterium]